VQTKHSTTKLCVNKKKRKREKKTVGEFTQRSVKNGALERGSEVFQQLVECATEKCNCENSLVNEKLVLIGSTIDKGLLRAKLGVIHI